MLFRSQAAAKGQDFWPYIVAIADTVFASLLQACTGALPALLAVCDLLLIVNAGQGEPGSASKKRAKNERDKKACFFRLVVAGA